MNVFDEMGTYWSEIADQNQTERQIHFLKNTLKLNGLILDLACGTGRHMISLNKQGYSVVGLDVSLKLLKMAKNRWRKAPVVCADMRFLPFKAETFSAAINMDTSFGYLPSERDDLQSLIALRETLKKDGMLILDLFNREHLIKEHKALSQPKWREYPSFFLQQKRTVDAKGSFLHDGWTVRDKTDGQVRFFEHKARLYKLNQLQGLLEHAGFSVNVLYGDYEGQSFSADSKRLILIANKMIF